MRLFKKLRTRGLYGALFERAALSKVNGKSLFVLFLFFQLIFIGFAGVGWSIFKQTNLSNQIAHDIHLINNISILTGSEFYQLGEVSLELKKRTEMLLSENRTQAEILNTLGDEFMFLAKTRSFYDQVRLFDEAGQELIRIDNTDGQATIIPPDQLTDKSGRPYFETIRQLAGDEYYLNRPQPMTEDGELLTPVRTAVQSFFPVTDPGTGDRFGYININLDTDPLFGEIRANLMESDGETHIIAEDGTWMYSRLPGEEFETFLGRGLSYQTHAPAIWTQAVQGSGGVFETRDQTVIFKKIPVEPNLNIPTFGTLDLGVDPRKQRFSEGFYLVSIISPAELGVLFQRAPGTILSVWGTYMLFTFTLSLYIAYLVATRSAMQDRTRHSLKMEAVGELTGGVAHDFNNLLTAIIGNLSLLEREQKNKQHKELMKNARQAAWRGAELTKRLLAFSRKQNLAPESRDLNEILEETAPLIIPTVGSNIDFELEPAKEPMMVHIDALEYQNVVLNLAINARDAMKDGGKLNLSVYADRFSKETAKKMEVEAGRYIITKMTDNGVGMPLSVQKQAIDPFFTTKPIGEGSGLGLSMAYGFARQSGGELKIISQEGKGTTILIILPAIG